MKPQAASRFAIFPRRPGPAAIIDII